MVAKASSATAAKRKKTGEMEDSPPKRLTRARTAKVSDDTEVPIKAKKAVKAPTKVAAEKKKTPAKSLTIQKKAPMIKRKTRADDDTDALNQDSEPKSEVAEEPRSKPATTRGGSKKAPAPVEEQNADVVDVPKPRGRQAKTPKEKTKATTTTTRGRAKKAGLNELVDGKEPVETVKKATRGRVKITAKVDAPKTQTRARTTKKVQFEEEIDKENIPIQTESKKTGKSAMKPIGIRAKPVRKPAATRQRKTVKDQEQKQQEQLPLSPKKVNQIAKAGSATSEDELASEQTTVLSPIKSPMKLQTSPIRVVNMTTAPSSPSMPSPADILAGSVRRPPPSPFKDGLKMSPKKVDINFSIEKPVFHSTLNKTPAKSSLLQESPRKVRLQSSVSRPVLAATQSPMKTSLLQSPARRPTTSPFKRQGSIGTISNSIPLSPIKKLPSSPKPMHFSPQEAASSPLRAAKSPERRLQVHMITPRQQEPQPIFEAPSPDMEDSPCKPASSEGAINEANVNIMDVDTTMQDVENVEFWASQDVTTAPLSSAFTMTNEELRRVSIESSSTDELVSPDKAYAPTPLRKNWATCQDFSTPSASARAAVIEASNDVSFTPLVGKLGGWTASSPNKQAPMIPSRQTRGIFSLGGAAATALQEESPFKETSPVNISFFEEQLAIMDEELDEAQEIIDAGFEIVAEGEASRIALQSSMDSQTSEEYGDENAAPTKAEMLREEQDNDHTLTCTPAKVFNQAKVTPVKPIMRRPQEVHTVSKVPLRASGEDSPLKASRQRSKSMGGPLSTVPENHALTAVTAGTCLTAQPETPKLGAVVAPQTPSSGFKLDAGTPGRSVRKDVAPNVLKGAIVYVDVHTSEGADASGIFVDLLTQMGARCVKQWSWNPRVSVFSSVDGAASPPDDSPNSSLSLARVGITHVVYKDGGKRTLEKVRHGNGVVLCVGVGWVLDCEREGKWLDEADYSIDTTIIPRGGSRRRKSMEPRALANLGKNFIPAGDEVAQSPADCLSPTQEFLSFDTPASRRETFVIKPLDDTVTDIANPAKDGPSTPIDTMADGESLMEDKDGLTTPYYLSRNAQLVQSTCPAKQAGEALFPINRNENEHVKRKLLEARRKSMAFISNTRSPLGRTVSYGEDKSL